MYAFIRGTITSIREDYVVLDNNGIGYRIFISSALAEKLAVGEEIRLFTHFAVREDAMLLYGFESEEELELFRLILGVSGIGPKGAIGIFSVMTPDDLRFAILSDDAAQIAKAPGIGKKTAQKVILELKDKLDLMESFERKAANTEAVSSEGNAQTEAVLALTALGYARNEAMKAVRTVCEEESFTDVEEILKAALREL
ncbi:MAG: Holliday junction branch migration protein RuvA [Lachnospiraceae bacterium]|nr:Holliday junction branch migration protein RuvA [Lachnospiraceae bacterium]